MSEPNIETLSERERECLEHFRQAQELQVSFAEYCRSFGLKENVWYALRRGLVQKGVMSAGEGQRETKPAGFAPVRVVATPSSSAVAWRIRHASGWTIECGSVPDVAWVRALLTGAGT